MHLSCDQHVRSTILHVIVGGLTELALQWVTISLVAFLTAVLTTDKVTLVGGVLGKTGGRDRRGSEGGRKKGREGEMNIWRDEYIER